MFVIICYVPLIWQQALEGTYEPFNWPHARVGEVCSFVNPTWLRGCQVRFLNDIGCCDLIDGVVQWPTTQGWMWQTSQWLVYIFAVKNRLILVDLWYLILVNRSRLRTQMSLSLSKQKTGCYAFKLHLSFVGLFPFLSFEFMKIFFRLYYGIYSVSKLVRIEQWVVRDRSHPASRDLETIHLLQWFCRSRTSMKTID